jgi:hypothetical protein
MARGTVNPAVKRRKSLSRQAQCRLLVTPPLSSCIPTARRGEKRAFNMVAAWFSFSLFFPILLMSRLA